MSFKRRLILGGSAGFALMGVTALNQLALVPLLLSHWTAAEYGVWLTVQALVAFSTSLSMGYKTFLEFEFIKIGHLQPGKISQLLYSSILPLVFLSLIELAVVWLICSSAFVGSFLGLNAELLSEARGLWLALSLSWVFGSVVPGIFQRAFVPFGFYANNAWWYVVTTIANTLSVVAAVAMGEGLVVAGFFNCISNVMLGVCRSFYLVRIAGRFGVAASGIDRDVLSRSVLPALGMTLKNSLQIFQQQGVRVILTGMFGPAMLASFSTIRTLSNVVMQGNQAVLYPMVPEVMRFMRESDEVRVRRVFNLMWIIGLVGGGVFLCVLKMYMPQIFEVWTRGFLAYDPVLFSLVAASLVVFSFYQPFLAVVRGMNMVGAQLIATVASTTVLVLVVSVFGKAFGIAAAGGAVFLAEVVLACLYLQSARKGFREAGVAWPLRNVGLACFALITFSLFVLI